MQLLIYASWGAKKATDGKDVHHISLKGKISILLSVVSKCTKQLNIVGQKKKIVYKWKETAWVRSLCMLRPIVEPAAGLMRAVSQKSIAATHTCFVKTSQLGDRSACLPCQGRSQVEHGESLLYVNISCSRVIGLYDGGDCTDDPACPKIQLTEFKLYWVSYVLV